MAEHGEWNKQGATLSDLTAKSEFGVDREFIVQGIEAGKLEYREGRVWGNPYLRILRSQLETYITSEFGPEYLTRIKTEYELCTINKQITQTKKKLKALETRRGELENVQQISKSSRTEK